MPEGQSKLEAAYSGPYTVAERVSPVTYRLKLLGHGKKGKIVHINLMKAWKSPPVSTMTVATVSEGWTEGEGDLITLDTSDVDQPRLGNNLNSKQRQCGRLTGGDNQRRVEGSCHQSSSRLI